VKNAVEHLKVILIAGSIIWAVYERLKHHTYSIEAVVAIAYLAFLVLVLLIAVVWQEYRLARKARYAEIIEHQRTISELVREAAAKDRNKAEFIELFTNILDQLADAFGLLTATKCATCLKILAYEHRQPGGNPEPLTETVCRDKTSAAQRYQPVNTVLHWVSENTDFHLVHTAFPGPDAVFFSNNLATVPGYRNTSATQLSHVTLNPTRVTRLKSEIFWPLKYRSTIVVPVRSRNSDGHDCLRGYLCVDSRSRGVFDPRFDLELMQSVSSLLGPIFGRYYDLMWSTRNSEEKSDAKHATTK
jgi:hypothetical protein